MKPALLRSAITVACVWCAGVIAACGSAVPISGQVAPPTPACTTPGPATQTDSFDETVTLTTASDGLQYGDIRVGCGSQAKAGSTVTVEYTGWLAGGKEFDSSRSQGRQPFTFVAGQGQVIQGFDEGVIGLRVGGKRRLVLPPSLGYGPSGNPPVIPANATLYFDVELVAVS